MKTFKIRASAVSQIMTNSRKKGELSKTAQSYCKKWLKEQLYERRQNFQNKYTDKGLIMEDNALDFVAERKDYGMLIKNEEYLENEFFTGTPDNIQPDHVIDTKCSWDEQTFPLFETVLNPVYDGQGQIYMHLTGRKQHKVFYCLMDTPENIIEREARNYSFKNGYGDLTEEIFQDFKKKMTFGTVPANLRIKEFTIDYNHAYIAEVETRVIECRTFIDELLKTI